MTEKRDAEIAKILADAWEEYATFYGQPPHGTFTQLHSMLALKNAGNRIEALLAQRPEVAAPSSKEPELRAMLQRLSVRVDGDGEICWCANGDQVLRDHLFQIPHRTYCLEARTLLGITPTASSSGPSQP
jgi:hypothetical protein